MIDKLEFFIALAREKHFGRAAELCGVTQPTLSAGIKQLEEQLGVMLVMRGSRFQGLTPEGVQVLRWARRIVGDARAMREEMRAARHGLSGHIRIAAIPTALAMVARLTTPFREKHPGVTFSILSRTSIEVLTLLGNFEIDAGVTYLDNEPLGRVASVPLYEERYQLITSTGNPFADRDKVTWAEVSRLPLCLLTPDMQNRRIIDQHLAEAGVQVRPTLESNSMIVLFSHIRTGKWSSIMPLNLTETFGFSEPIHAIPIVEPDASHMVGLVASPRAPQTPLVSALLDEAMTLASRMGVMSDGRLVQVGGPRDLYEFPANRFVAQFIGAVNLFDGVVIEDEPGHARMRCDEAGCVIHVSHGVTGTLGQTVYLAIRPEKINLGHVKPDAEENVAPGTVDEVAYLGNLSVYQVRLDTGRLVHVTLPNLDRHEGTIFEAGDAVYCSWGAASAVVLPA